MAQSQVFWIQRLSLAQNVTTPIRPPRFCQDVSIGNATLGDLQIYSAPDDDAAYRVVESMFEWDIATHETRFCPDEVGFWLKAAQAGTVVLTWR